MSYTLTCSCGRGVAVEGSQAGTSVACGCGEPLKVPSLGALRVLAGGHAYEVNTIEVITGMVNRGELPAGRKCSLSGESTEDVFDLFVEVEANKVPRDVGKVVLLSLLFGWGAVLALLNKSAIRTRESPIVRTPLRVAAPQHARLRKARQRSLKKWLRTVPVYAKLLDESPNARILIEGPKPVEYRSLDVG